MAQEPPSGSVVEPPLLARELGERFAAAGYELYLVGGSVRDLVRDGSARGDLDFATSAHPTETTKTLRGWADRRYLVGVKFGTVGALKGDRKLEITTFRKEVYAEEHRKPAVTFGEDVLVDLSRRDFTFNAMALRLPDGMFVDPYGGLKALAAGVLDTPLDPAIAFSDDPLRMIRAGRFVAQLGVRPADRVVHAMRAMGERLEIVSAERMRDELDKLLVSERAAVGLALLVDTGLADLFLPELPALRLEQDPVHQHKDVLAHTYAVVERCEPDLVLRLAGLLHDIGKPATRQITPEGVTFHHHEMKGARMARARLEALRYPRAVIDDVCTLIELHLRFHGYGDGEGWSDAAVRRYVRDAGPLLDRSEPAHPRRCHDAQRTQGGLPRQASGRPRGTDRRARRTGEPGGAPTAARRTAGHGHPPTGARTRRRRGTRVPDGGAARARPDPRGRGRHPVEGVERLAVSGRRQRTLDRRNIVSTVAGSPRQCLRTTSGPARFTR